VDIIRPTELFQRILADAIKIKPVSVMIDTLTDVYAGDEINRNQTTQFVKLLQHMAIKARCSVAILAHPSNAGMATGSGLSGSTGWHNKVRSRLYMRAPTTAKGEEIDSDVREIQFLTNNYGDSIQIRWENGVFVPESGPASFDHLVGADEQLRWFGKVEHPGGLGKAGAVRDCCVEGRRRVTHRAEAACGWSTPRVPHDETSRRAGCLNRARPVR
jgi:RecA-family ATPase